MSILQTTDLKNITALSRTSPAPLGRRDLFRGGRRICGGGWHLRFRQIHPATHDGRLGYPTSGSVVVRDKELRR